MTLPTYEPNPLALAAADSPRYIDVSFAITKYGVGERVDILGASKGVTREEERDLVRMIESTSFRPRFLDGKLADVAPIAMRYRFP